MQLRDVSLHGHIVRVRTAGPPAGAGVGGRVIVLVHGIAGDGEVWHDVLDALGQGGYSVLAPDLPGHGGSDKPPLGDYSLGSFASVLRDLLVALGHDRASVVGHSLGGGVAMQFAYQFPERCERLVLVSSGGLGRGVTRFLRAATLPGAELVLPLIAHSRLRSAAAPLGRLLARTPLAAPPGAQEVWRSLAGLQTPDSRRAFLATARSVLDLGGQRVDATDRLYLSAGLPLLLVWGSRDAIIPVAHGVAAAESLPDSHLELFERSGHFPMLDEPERFSRRVLAFCDSTEPASHDPAALRERILSASPQPG